MVDLKKFVKAIRSRPEDPIRGFVDSVLTANKSKDFVKRMFEKNPRSVPDPEDSKSTMTHYMEVSDGMAYPRVVNMNGKLQFLNSNDAYNYARKSGEFIKFADDKEALKFTENYKKGSKVTIGK
jgi:hypothetical protein